MTIQDDDGELVAETGTIQNIEWDESNSGNEYLALHIQTDEGQQKKLWVWSHDWQNDLTQRKNLYMDLRCEFVYAPKYPPHYMVFKYLIPQEKHDEWTIYKDQITCAST